MFKGVKKKISFYSTMDAIKLVYDPYKNSYQVKFDLKFKCVY